MCCVQLTDIRLQGDVLEFSFQSVIPVCYLKRCQKYQVDRKWHCKRLDVPLSHITEFTRCTTKISGTSRFWCASWTCWAALFIQHSACQVEVMDSSITDKESMYGFPHTNFWPKLIKVYSNKKKSCIPPHLFEHLTADKEEIILQSIKTYISSCFTVLPHFMLETVLGQHTCFHCKQSCRQVSAGSSHQCRWARQSERTHVSTGGCHCRQWRCPPC